MFSSFANEIITAVGNDYYNEWLLHGGELRMKEFSGRVNRIYYLRACRTALSLREEMYKSNDEREKNPLLSGFLLESIERRWAISIIEYIILFKCIQRGAQYYVNIQDYEVFDYLFELGILTCPDDTEDDDNLDELPSEPDASDDDNDSDLEDGNQLINPCAYNLVCIESLCED